MSRRQGVCVYQAHGGTALWFALRGQFAVSTTRWRSRSTSSDLLAGQSTCPFEDPFPWRRETPGRQPLLQTYPQIERARPASRELASDPTDASLWIRSVVESPRLSSLSR